MLPYLGSHFGNAASQHALGRQAAAAVADARESVAALIGASPQEIIFTSGATESINLALKGVVGTADHAQKHVVTVATEHKAVLDTARALQSLGVRVSVLPVEADGRHKPETLAASLDDETVLVSVMTANNETGVLNPITQLGDMARRAGAIFHTDATQAIGKMAIDVRAMSVDLMSFSAHKIHGPKGVGALYVRRHVQDAITPQLHGGGHERGLRSGTINVPAVVGFGEAARIAANGLHHDANRMRTLRDRLEVAILGDIAGSSVNGNTTDRLPNISNIHVPGVEADSLVLAMPDVAISSGSACTAASLSPSHVLLAMGLGYEASNESIRFSLGRFTTERDIDVSIERTIAATGRLRKVRGAVIT
jgi:cysteine desulfurase